MLGPEARLKTIAVFVDVQNIYYTCRQAYGKQFNYRLFWQQLQQQGQIVHAVAYAIARADDQQRKFQDALRHIGFTVRLKPFIQRSDGTAKGDWDVGITIDVLQTAPTVDEIVLLSGDGDFDLLLQAVHQRFGTASTVFGVPGLTAHALINSANRYCPIDADLLC